MGTELYPGIAFSPQTAIANNIGAADTIIEVLDVSAFPPAPNLATIGTDEEGETVLYTAKTGTALSGCRRGVEGTARAWKQGEVIGRNFTAKDHADLIAAVSETREAVETAQSAAAASESAAKGAQEAAASAEGAAAQAAETASTAAQNAAQAAEAAETAAGAAATAQEAADAAGAAATSAAAAAEAAQGTAEEVAAGLPVVWPLTLAAEDWAGDEAPYAQTLAVPGVLADEDAQIIHVLPGDLALWARAGAACTGQGVGTLAFTAREKAEIQLRVAVQAARKGGNGA